PSRHRSVFHTDFGNVSEAPSGWLVDPRLGHRPGSSWGDAALDDCQRESLVATPQQIPKPPRQSATYRLLRRRDRQTGDREGGTKRSSFGGGCQRAVGPRRPGGAIWQPSEIEAAGHEAGVGGKALGHLMGKRLEA